jgi:uncharacterized protein (TIGR02996 family)
MVEFVGLLNATVLEFEETLVPVLRGSLLLHHWFGDKARPAADIDLECFERPKTEPIPEYVGAGHGRFGEYSSLVDFGKAMCRYAADSSYSSPTIKFAETDAPADGQSLWTYGTPGERYYAGWTWQGKPKKQGLLQIDIAEAGSYHLEDIDVASIAFPVSDGEPINCPAYTREMLLAAKLSWLLRGLQRRQTAAGLLAPIWKGEPKDLFDAHLLSSSNLHAGWVQKSLLAVGAEDKLEWNNLEALFDVQRVEMTDADFPNWKEFHVQHQNLLTCGPAEMLRTIAERLQPLLGDFYLPEEMPFLLAINAEPTNEFPYLIYADWLEEQGILRSEFLRLYTRFHFHEDELAPKELAHTRLALQKSLRHTSAPWLCQLFGTSARVQELQRRVENRS